MKTSLLALFTTMLVAAASAAPLSPGVPAAIGGGVAATNQLRATAASGLSVTPFTPHITLAVPVAPVPVFIAPVAVRARCFEDYPKPHIHTPMKTLPLRPAFPSALAAAVLVLSVSSPAFAASSGTMPRAIVPHPLADAAPADEITRTGVIERRVAIGGETTGWVLRDEKGKTTDLLLPIAAFATIRDGMHVVIKGKLGTKTYPERGKVSVFHVREISEIVY